ncbi:MAG: hypothetical protein H6R19_2976 [Proteobacteria bacterium]|nr:hypothetical protein [Pseudomonadota bacterium]
MGVCALACSVQAQAEFMLDAINLPMLYAVQSKKPISYPAMLQAGRYALPASVRAKAMQMESLNEFLRREGQEFMVTYLNDLWKVIEANPQDLVIADGLGAVLEDFDFDKKHFPVFLQLPPAVPPYSGSFYCNGAIDQPDKLLYVVPCFAVDGISTNRRPYVLGGFSSAGEAQAFKETYRRGNIRPLLHIKQMGPFAALPKSDQGRARTTGLVGAVAPAVPTALYFQDTKSGAIWQATALQDGVAAVKPRSTADSPRVVTPLAPQVPGKATEGSGKKVLIKVDK